MKYAEYLEIDQNYYPEVNPDSIKENKMLWEYTYPHKTFVTLLDTTERMLARETGTDKHGIWVEGSYGTGKSRVLWTMENLLTCSDEKFRAYFDRYTILKKQPDLRDKLLAHKEGKIIVVTRYASGEIDNINKFIAAVYESVSKALQNAGVEYNGQSTLRGSIAAWLEDESHKDIFKIMMEKPEYRGLGSFNGRTPDDILALLNNTSVNVDFLVNDIVGMAGKEGITAFKYRMSDLKAWLTNIIDTNDLKAVVFFWDEFSSFFKNNMNSLDTFQELAELSESKPFYLIIASHLSGSLASPGERGDKKTKGSFNAVYDRFHHVSIEMPNDVAFELIHDAIKIRENGRKEYEDLTEELNETMYWPRKRVCEFAGVSEDIMKGMLPLHPLTALMLKYIASSFASNQRSMFNFIKNKDSERLQAFQWFINTHSPDDGQILTIDYLWNFFYESGTDENTSATGKSNLDFTIATILDTYPMNEDKLDDSVEGKLAKRVLKAVLMMQAISKKLNNAVDLFRTTPENIKLAFTGDADLEENRAINIIENVLLKKKILYEDSDGRIREYAASAVAGDQVQIDSEKEKIRANIKTAKLIDEGNLQSAFSFTDALKARFEFYDVTVDNFTATMNRITNKKYSYQIPAVICYARDEEEQRKMSRLIPDAVRNNNYRRIVIIDASSNLMGVDRFERYLDLAAQEEYWRSKDPKLANNDKKVNKEKVLGEWKTVVENGTFIVYLNYNDIYSEQAKSQLLLNDKLAEMVLKIYPLSFDNAKVSGNLFTKGTYAADAKYGVNQTFGGVCQEASIRAVLGEIWGVPEYWEIKKLHPVSQLKRMLDELITKRLREDVRISVSDIFEFLMEKGFMPCDLYAYLTGFLLKEYSTDQYRYGIGSSGDNGGVMTPDKLGEYIGEYIKHKNKQIKGYTEKYIEIMTQDQKAFVTFAHNAFEIPDDLSVEQTASRMRVKLNNIGYPLWCFKYIDTHDLGSFIDILAKISNGKSNDHVGDSASKFGKLLRQVPSASENLKQLITPDNGNQAMMEFLEQFENGEVLSTATEIGIKDPLGDVKRQIGSGDAAWLWDQNTGEEELEKLLTEYRIVRASNAAGSFRASSFSECILKWRSYVNFLKIPCTVCKEKMPELRYFFECLKQIVTDNDLTADKHNKFLQELEGKRADILALKERKMEIFKEEYSIYLAGFSDGEIEKIYSKLPNGSFTLDKFEYEQKVQMEADQVRKEQDRFRLLALWEELTQTKTPNDWCVKYQTPIRALVPETEQGNAKRLFQAIDNNTVSRKEVTFALEYLNGRPAFIDDLNDTEKIEAAFTKSIVGRYSSILRDNDVVRTSLKEHVGSDVYAWYGEPHVSEHIKKLARSIYIRGANQMVMEKIDSMSADDVKEFLKKMIKEDVDVGISIIEREGEWH